jgi:D-cysteine desulfhydrase
MRTLLDTWPSLIDHLPYVKLGDFPTPVESLAPVLDAMGKPGAKAWVKRDDLSSALYGGNKVRTLEVLFGQALQKGATYIYATGAFGSNHAAATVLHARRANLKYGVILFPQPPSPPALENLRVILSTRPEVVALRHWASLPFGMYRARRRHERVNEVPDIMVPGGATPAGALGYVSAALELARQIEEGELPRPGKVIIGVGSTCTSAGLLVGFYHAARLRIGFTDRSGNPAPPLLVSVRVTPWPVTSPIRITRLAVQTSSLLAELTGETSLRLSYKTLRALLRVDNRFIGRGYGKSTPSGREAIELFRRSPGLELDTTYSGKSAAAVVHMIREGEVGPVLYWSTKSTAVLPEVRDEELEWVPAVMKRWIRKAHKELRT